MDANKINIYVDCSRTAVFGGNTGMQRVTRNLAKEFTPIVLVGSVFHQISSKISSSDRWLRIAHFVKRLFFEKKKNTPKSLVGPQSRLRIYHFFSLRFMFGSKIHFKKGDVVILSDYFLLISGKKIIQEIKEVGVIILVLLHDLIPLRFPEFCNDFDVLNFKNTLTTAVDNAHALIVTTRFVERDITKYYSEQGLKPVQMILYHLGRNIDEIDLKKFPIRESVKSLFKSPSPTFIAVSTIEPRKNYIQLLRAFDLLWKKGVEVQLCIIGKPGWMCDDILKEIKDNTELNKRLYMFSDISNTELAYCYKHAWALVAPSLTEGFGLPIAEALNYNLPVVVSDIEVFREITKNTATYFDPNDKESIAHEIENSIRVQNELTNKIATTSLPTWSDSNQKLRQDILRLINNT